MLHTGADEAVHRGDATGEGTAASPFNTVKALEFTKALAADATTEQEYYVQGTVTSIKELSTQDKLKNAFVLNLSIGKVVYLKKVSLNFNLNVNNILNKIREEILLPYNCLPTLPSVLPEYCLRKLKDHHLLSPLYGTFEQPALP